MSTAVTDGVFAAEALDEELAERFRVAGDREALATLVERYSPKLRRLLYTMLGGDAEQIADAEQEVYVTLIRKIDRFRGDARFSTFFYSLARNRVLDLMRAERRRRDRTVRHENPDAFAGTAEDPAEQSAGAVDAELLSQAMESLGDQDRFLLYLKDGEGESIEALCAMCGMPSGTVKSRLARARRRVARRMEELGYER